MLVYSAFPRSFEKQSKPSQFFGEIKFFFMIALVISFQIRSFFWYVFSRIQCKYGKILTKKNPHYGTFHTV